MAPKALLLSLLSIIFFAGTAWAYGSHMLSDTAVKLLLTSGFAVFVFLSVRAR